MVKSSVKLPLMIAAPVLLVIGGVAAFFLLPDPPAPPPQPAPQPLDNTGNERPPDNGEDPLPVEIDPRPRPEPNNGAPDSAALADAMLEEAWGAMENIRSRLELKYKYAEYTLDRELTLEAVMRKLSRLDGTHFKGADYALSFPPGEGDLVRIECRTIETRPLPDGPLVMTVDMRTGETSKEGTIFARNTEGYVLLGDPAYRALTEIFQYAVNDHFSVQQETPEGLADVELLMPDEPEAPFKAGDFKVSKVGEMGFRISCSSVSGEAIASPVSLTGDYESNTISVSTAASEDWMRPPTNREEVKDRLDYVLRTMARAVFQQMDAGKKPAELRVYRLNAYYWYLRWAQISPFDIRFEVTEGETRKVTFTVATSFGKALPFKPVRYVATSGDERGEYLD